MKLVEALQIANAAQEGLQLPPFQVLLACGFTPLHLQTAVKAHLRQRLAGRSVVVRIGLYGDLARTLERELARKHERLDAVLVALEWGDLDFRLGWRATGKMNQTVIHDVRQQLLRLEKAIAALASKTRVALSLPFLPLPPVFSTASNELNPIEAKLREMLYSMAVSTPALVLHPATLGQGSGHDLRAELLNGFPYTFAHADALASGLVCMSLPQPPQKGLITDLDETLWGGVLGDDGPENVSWDLDHKTQFHALYQSLLEQLAEAGTLLAVASKNDAGLVEKALERRDLLVKAERLFPIEANWGSKVESVGRVLQAWNVGADSVVFVDDNPLEVEQVRAAFPTMECLQFHSDDARFLIELRDRFAKREVREEDKLRLASLRAGQAMRQQASSGTSLDTLLAGAEARLTFTWCKQPSDPRALELVNKTNQFNLNGIRHSEADWNTYLSDPQTRLAVVEYEDRFGKLGKIAVLAGREEEDASFEVAVWVMSCRAFSRRIEHQCLKQLLNGWDLVRLRWQPTDRNGPMRDFLAEIAPGNPVITRADFDRRCPPMFHQIESKQTECASV
jgi:FkbH-like protein